MTLAYSSKKRFNFKDINVLIKLHDQIHIYRETKEELHSVSELVGLTTHTQKKHPTSLYSLYEFKHTVSELHFGDLCLSMHCN